MCIRLGLKTIGYCPQGTFLASLGIEEIVSKELEGNPAFQREFLKIKSLLFGMGESHQVMIQYKGKKDIQSLKGFELRNRVNVL
jgi:SAM-dependent MidA family methyltransferase